jgi:hypothetical protein
METVKSIPSIKKVYWSGIVNVTKGSGGKYTAVEHFDIKVNLGNLSSQSELQLIYTIQAEITDYAKELGVPVVDVQPAMYMENILGAMAPRKVCPSSAPFVLMSFQTLT